MSKVQQIEAELEKLTPTELRQVREWLEDFFEDHLAFTDEFEAKIRQSESEMAEGKPARTRSTPGQP